MFEELFRYKAPNADLLLNNGFVKTENGYRLQQKIMGGDFTLFVTVGADGTVDTELTEAETNEAYVLYKTNAQGKYIGEVRAAVEAVLADIAATCFKDKIFQFPQTERLIRHVRERYGDEPEYLWKKFPQNAVWRRKDNKKWYGAVLSVEGVKLGLDTEEIVEIVDLRGTPEEIPALLERQHYYPGWHMNKKSWYTVVLDDSVPDDELWERIRQSYLIAQKSK